MKTLLCTLFCSVTTAALALDSTGWTLTTGQSWQVSGTIKGKGKKDLSAVDLISAGSGLLASDEGSSVYPVKLDAASRMLTIGQGQPLLGPKLEADIEGIAAAPAENCYYVTGSHAVARKKLELEPSRFHIFRVGTDPATLGPSGKADTASLRPVMESLPELKPFLDQPPHANGIDIEGLAWKDGRLFVGFRAPFHGDHAWVLETGAKAIFDGGEAGTKLHALPLGRATGIRALSAVREGFVFLSGDSGQEQSTAPPALYFWKPGSVPEKLGTVPPNGKPEALTVLSESETGIELLMLSDGPELGGPVALHIQKRQAEAEPPAAPAESRAIPK